LLPRAIKLVRTESLKAMVVIGINLVASFLDAT
jgi:hypothetical protein